MAVMRRTPLLTAIAVGLVSVTISSQTKAQRVHRLEATSATVAYGR
jgi:hypothetical protein